MSKTLDSVLLQLRELGSNKVDELDALYEEQRAWLWGAANSIRQQIIALGPTIKKQKTGIDSSVGLVEEVNVSICILGKAVVATLQL